MTVVSNKDGFNLGSQKVMPFMEWTDSDFDS